MLSTKTRSDSGFGGLRGGAVANEEERDVVGLAGAARKILDGIDDSLLELIERRVVLAGKSFAEAGNTEHLLFGVHGFGDAVAEEDQRVAGLERHAGRGVFGFGNQADRKRALA